MLFGRDFLSAILAVALSATHAEATIAIGTAGNLNVMWVDGTNPCEWSKLSSVGTNPCGILSNPLRGNGYRYSLQGCGGSGLWLDNEDGSFNSNCRDASAKLACGVHREWVCS